ncbi:hypothetical protein L1987_62331 [Smallanthus sonchifolius]|uniref:Uncharacterized protein n=1 Tax=Smallanthus sonchifolius TaxID=185202 RepID=A0ACB9CAC7_9ASTR|nr:hypothetical protein L1987_62331 [Smallanthus sonchifolius]
MRVSCAGKVFGWGRRANMFGFSGMTMELSCLPVYNLRHPISAGRNTPTPSTAGRTISTGEKIVLHGVDLLP